MTDSTLTVRIEGKDTLSNELKTAQSNVIRFVGAVSSALAAMAGIAFPVMDSARFQRELLEAGKTTNYSKSQLEELKKSLVDLSTQINVTAIDLAKIAAMGGQMGIGGNGNVSALAAFTEEVARAVTALDMPAEQAVMALGKLINIFNVPASKFRHLISSLNEVSNSSNATAEELFDVARRIGNLGGAVSMPEAAALSASMIDLGQTAETAGTTLTKVFADMRSKAADFAAFIGKDMTEQKWVDMLQGRGLQALDMYLDRLNQIAPAAAAAAKVDLTGGGRIFEAVTKLQAQRKRATALELAANRESERIAANKENMELAEVKRAELRVQSLRDLAKEANVVTRLTEKANQAYASGDSAMREQQTVLSGLMAQWDVFLNNARKAAMGLGDAALLPLTQMLRSMSEALQSSDMSTQLGDGMREVMENAKAAAEYVSYFVGDLKSISSGVEWGEIISITALIATAGAIRLATTALRAWGSSVASNSPAISSFNKFLFGTSEAMRQAQAEADELAKRHERTGGVYDRVAGRMTGFVEKVAQVNTLNDNAARTQNAINSAQQVHAQRLQAVQAAYQGVGARLQTQAALQTSIAAAQNRLAAAQASGNNRAIASNNRVIATQTAVLNAVQAAQERADSAARAIQRMQTSLASTQQQAQALTSTSVGMALAFEQARNAGMSMGMALTTAIGAASSGSFLAGLSTQINAAKVAIASFGVSTATAFKQGQVGATGLRGQIAGVAGAFNYLTTALHVQVSSGISAGLARVSAALLALRQQARDAALAATGMAEYWAIATTSMQRGVIGVVVATRLLAQTVGLARKAMLSLVNIGFAALLVKDLLQFLGVWNNVLDAVAKVYEFFGGDKDKLPSWLKSEKQMERAVKLTEAQALATAKQREEAAKYNEVAKTTLMLMASKDSAESLLTYDDAEPTAAMENVVDGISTVLAAQSKLTDSTEEITALERQRLKLSAELLQQRRDLAAAEGKAGEGTALRRMQETEAAMRNVIAALEKRKEIEADLQMRIQPATEQLTQAILTQADAQAILTRNADTGKSKLEEYTDAQAQLLKAQQAIDVHTATNQAAFRAPTDSGGQAQAEEYAVTMKALEAGAEEAAKRVAKLRVELGTAVPDNLPLAKAVDAISKSADGKAVESIGKRMADTFEKGLGAFSGITIPQIKMDSLLEAGITHRTAAEMRTMYDEMAAVATARANQAKQAVTTSMEDVRRATKVAADAVAEFDKAWEATQRKQSLYKGDQNDQKRLRERMSEIDAEESKAIESADRIYGHNADLLRREKLYISEKYRQQRTEAQNAADIKTGKRDVAYELKQYDALVAKINTYKKAMADADAVLRNPSATVAEHEEALSKLEGTTIKATESIQQLDRMRQTLVSRDPVGDKLLISDADVARLRKDAETIGIEVAKASGASASVMEGVLKRIASSYADSSKMYGDVMDVAAQRIANFGAVHHGQMEGAVRDMTTAMATAKEYADHMESVRKIVASIKLDPANLDKAALKTQVLSMSRDVAEAIGETPRTLKLTVDQQALQASLVKEFAAITATPGGLPKAPMDVTAQLGNGVDLRKDVENVLSEPFNISVKANQTGRGSTTPAYARGGLVEVLKSFALGGKVTGPGTGTSDSILARLSNGEFVMDALTTRTFGSKFFASLQQMARAGRAGGFKLPGFARGGQVGNPFAEGGVASSSALSNLVSGGQGGDTGSMEVVNVNLNVGGERVSLYASRKNAGKLVRTLKGMEAGA